jgi:hypothetical protein
MTPRHSAALALVGWYLMVPPRFHGQLRVNFHAPLTTWSTLEVFDRAAECKNAEKRHFDDAIPVPSSHLDDPRTQKESQTVQWSLSQCVASDDPRLKEK